MEENKEKENVTENKNLPVQSKVPKMSPKAYDNLVKFGKSLGLGVGAIGLLVAGAGASVLLPIAGNVVGTAGMLAGVWQAVRSIVTATNNLEPSLMFCSKKMGDELTISQDTRLNLASKMKGYKIADMGGMMQLQALVGFSRYKENFRQGNAPYTVDENGTKIYDQKISTVTHSINLKTLDALETLGYINSEGYWQLNWSEDRFVINGITYKPSGDTQVAQAKDEALCFIIILKRDRDTQL